MPKVNGPAAPRSLLILKPSSLGDIVHALQVVRTVARRLPDCRITWVARDRFAPLVEAAPFVHEVIHFRRKNGWRGILEVMKTLRARQFDVVWDMQGLLRSGLMAAAARSPVKRGRHDSREGAALFSRKVGMPPGNGPHHAIPVLLEFARSLGIDDEVRIPLELRPGPDFPWKSFFEGDPARRFVIFTDSRGVEKEWPKFSELTRLIFENIADSRVAWCAGNPAAPDFPVPDGRFLNLTGCPFDEMIELARQPSVFIGNDSGPMHLSAAVGNRVLAIFGPTSPERFGPWPPGSPRTVSVVAPGGILADLTPRAVFDELAGLLARD
ncbi:MAG: glycosyltransferase family 9 protein [Luteolibacter sp.]|jgi:ADP-heptose:LPS heptosyltransferase|nr:glycosyltransferase family 9 protein [Luteolibacter sp.]